MVDRISEINSNTIKTVESKALHYENNIPDEDFSYKSMKFPISGYWDGSKVLFVELNLNDHYLSNASRHKYDLEMYCGKVDISLLHMKLCVYINVSALIFIKVEVII